MATIDRLSSVDLRDLTPKQHSALRREAIRRGQPFTEFLGSLVAEASGRLLKRASERAAGMAKKGGGR